MAGIDSAPPGRARGADLRVRDAAGVGFDLAAGGYGCLLGPAGAGKSGVLRAVCGLAPALGGTASLLLGGVEMRAVAPYRRRFALLAQDGGLVPGGNVAGAIDAGMAARGIARRQRAALRAALLEEFGLDGGMRLGRLDRDARLRVRLAAALAGEPVLLLLDDPLAVCDDRAAMIDLLRLVHDRRVHDRRRLLVLHATGRREEAFALASHLVLMDRGRVLQAGSASALYDRPDSLFIAGRLGPANLLDGRIEEIEDDVAYVRLACGPQIEADPPRPDVVVPAGGLACRVLLRPERISVSTVAAAELGSGAIAGVLRGITNMGDLLRLTVAIGTDTEIVVTRPAAIGAPGLAPGRNVAVAWQSRHALVFADAGEVGA